MGFIAFNVPLGTGSIGSDNIMPGCGSFAQCEIAGFWTLTYLPEPSSFLSLVGALVGMVTSMVWPGRRAGTRLVPARQEDLL